MKTRAAVAAVVVAVLGGLAGGRNGPSLEETFDWLNNSLTPVGGLVVYVARNGYSYHSCSAGCYEKELITDVSHNGCHVQVSKEIEIKSYGTFQYLEHDSFDLADIDLTSVKAGGLDGGSDDDMDGKVISLQTRNAKRVIQCQQKNMEQLDADGRPDKNFKPDAEFTTKCIGNPYNEQELRFKTQEYTARFAKAFRHAVELCGG